MSLFIKKFGVRNIMYEDNIVRSCWSLKIVLHLIGMCIIHLYGRFACHCAFFAGVDYCSGAMKIHKEKEKANKESRTRAKDEKKEKKREKKEKKREKVDQILVNSKHEEKSHKKRKYEEKKSLPEKEELFCQKTINDAVEQLEGSGLTEEHEMPCSIKYKHDSPESSQDSNKRRKLVPSSSSHNIHGSVLRIKLSASKQGGDSGSQSLPASRQGGDSGSQLLPPSRQGRGSKLLPTSRQGGDSASQLLPTSRQGGDSASQLPPASRQGGDSTSQLLPPLRRGGDSYSHVLLTSQRKPGVPLPSSRHKDPETPAAQAVPQVVPPAAKLKQLAGDQPAVKQLAHPVVKQLAHEQPAGKQLGRPVVKQLAHELPAVDEQPCFSGRSKEAPYNQEVTVPLPKKKSSSSKRIGGRTWQKEQFKDLIENWNPMSLQLESSDTGDEWLLAAPRQNSTSGSSVVSAEGSESGNLSIPSQQPRACYIPEFDMYQLPYVVPF